MKFLMLIFISINLFANIEMPSELFGLYFNTTLGSKTCISLEKDQDLWEVNQYGLSYGTWYVCMPTKIVQSKNNTFSINMDCGVDVGEGNTTKDIFIFKNHTISINNKIIAKRCKVK